MAKSDRQEDDNDMTELILKDAAQEIGVTPGYLRVMIGKGELTADKHGGRDWWIRRVDLRDFDQRRKAVGRPVDTSATTEEQARRRAYQREFRRRHRALQKKLAAEQAPGDRSGRGAASKKSNV